MAALKGFWNSERGILCVALLIAATVLAAISVISSDDWLSYSKWVFGVYVGGKTITGAVDVATKNIANGKKPDESSTPATGGAS